MIERAVILCAGLGTRLRPLTEHLPKPMLPVGGEPLLYRTLRHLAGEGVSEVTVTVHYLGHVIRDEVGDGSEFGLRVTYSDEPELAGSAGSIRGLAAFCDRTFAVVYGDVLAEFDLGALGRFHRERGAIMTLATTWSASPTHCGVVTADAEGRVRRFVEKPKWAFPDARVNAGIYLCEPEIIARIPKDHCDFGSDLIPSLVRGGDPVYATAIPGPVYDIGTLDGYARAERETRERSPVCR